MDGQGRSTQQVGEMNSIVTLEKVCFIYPVLFSEPLKGKS